MRSQTRPGYPSDLFPLAEKSLFSWILVLFFCGSIGHLNMPQGRGRDVSLAGKEGRDWWCSEAQDQKNFEPSNLTFCALFPPFLLSFLQTRQLHLNFIEYLLYSRHCDRQWGAQWRAERQPLANWSAHLQEPRAIHNNHTNNHLISYNRCIQGK